MSITDKYLERQLKKLSEVLTNNVISSMLTVNDFINRIDNNMNVTIVHNAEEITEEETDAFLDEKVLDFSISVNSIVLTV